MILSLRGDTFNLPQTQTCFILHTFIVLILLGKIILISIGLAIVCKKGPFWPRLGGTFGGMAPQRGTQTPAICGALKQWDLIRLSRISIEYYPTHGVQLELYFSAMRNHQQGRWTKSRHRDFGEPSYFLIFYKRVVVEEPLVSKLYHDFFKKFLTF